MSQSRGVSPRCVRCHMQAVLCVCDVIVSVPTRTHVCVLLHRMEQYKTSNTGFLATLALPNSSVHLHDEPITLQASDYVLFPSESAVPIEQVPRGARLIVPDATWQQARRMVRRNDALNAAQKVTLPMGLISQYGLRKRKREGGVCTLEAITAALAIVEGEDVRAPLEHLLTVFVDRMLWSRGKIKKEDVEGGVPHAALYHHGGTSRGYLAPAFAQWNKRGQ